MILANHLIQILRAQPIGQGRRRLRGHARRLKEIVHTSKGSRGEPRRPNPGIAR